MVLKWEWDSVLEVRVDLKWEWDSVLEVRVDLKWEWDSVLEVRVEVQGSECISRTFTLFVQESTTPECHRSTHHALHTSVSTLHF